jgi:hypothetical protein
MCTREPFVDYQVLTVTLGNQSRTAAAVRSPMRKYFISCAGPINTDLISCIYSSDTT